MLVHFDSFSIEEVFQYVDSESVEDIPVDLYLFPLCKVFFNEAYRCIWFVFDKSVWKIESVRWMSHSPIGDLALTDESVPPCVIARDVFVKFKEHHVVIALPYSVGTEDVHVLHYPLGDLLI